MKETPLSTPSVPPKYETPRSFYVAGTALGIIGLILVSKTIGTVPYFIHPDICAYGTFGKAYDMFGFSLGTILVITSALLFLNKKAGLYLYFLAALSPTIYLFFSDYLYRLCRSSQDVSVIFEYIALPVLSLLLIAFYTIMVSQYQVSRMMKGKKFEKV